MEELSDIVMGLLSLGGRRDFACTNGPHRLVCDHDFAAKITQASDINLLYQ